MSNSTDAYDDQNIFARILRGELPCHKIYEDDDTLAFMDVMPRSTGHCLVIPKQASRNLLDISSHDLGKLMAVVQRVMRAAQKALSADGITIQQFNEVAAGQEVFHTHIHILPRFDGIKLDPPGNMANDMNVLAEQAKLIASALESVSK